MAKADISIQTIIYAAIGLFVLILIVVILGNKAKFTATTTSDCVNNGGTCMEKCVPPDGKVLPYSCYTKNSKGKTVIDKSKRCCGMG